MMSQSTIRGTRSHDMVRIGTHDMLNTQELPTVTTLSCVLLSRQRCPLPFWIQGRKTMAAPEGSTGIIRISKACSSLHAHLLPCSISFTGPAPVSDYFRPKTTDSIIEGVEVKEAAFRGRKLLGRTTELPPGYCGLFLEKDASAEGGIRARKRSDDASTVDVWNSKATFKDITYWRHDDNPHSIESGHKFFDWLRLASMMHKPVSAEEVLMEQTKTGNSGQKRKLEQT